MLRIAVILCALAAPLAAHCASIERFQSFLRTTQSAKGEFEQKVFDRGGKLLQSARGSFVLQRPGRFRWMYTRPAEQLIVGDGTRVWIYDKELNQVSVRRIGAALGSTPAALLAGSPGWERAFDMSEAGERDGLEWMEARPRERDTGFERIRLGFGATGPEAMELLDSFGQVTVLRLTNLARNPDIDASAFRFVPPAGADVLGER
jgi:outer membrane lipoprotein carrier protein